MVYHFRENHTWINDMQLIFLFKNNVPTLVPKSACKYNKALDVYESQIPGLMLTVPAERYNPEFQFRYLYKAVFDRYCVATSVVLGYSIIFLFGKSSGGIEQYVVCSIRNGDLRNVMAYGLMLHPGTIMSAGRYNYSQINRRAYFKSI